MENVEKRGVVDGYKLRLQRMKQNPDAYNQVMQEIRTNEMVEMTCLRRR